jgi:hypothetical protein
MCYPELEAYKKCMDPIMERERLENEVGNQQWVQKNRESNERMEQRRQATS